MKLCSLLLCWSNACSKGWCEAIYGLKNQGSPVCVWRILFCHSWEGTKTAPLHEKYPSFPEWSRPVFSCMDPLEKCSTGLLTKQLPVVYWDIHRKNHMKLCTWNTYKFRLMLVNGQRRVINGWANDALLALLPLLLLAHCKDFFAVHNLFGIEWWWSNPACTLCGSGVLVFSGLAICTTKNSNNRKRLLFFKLHFYAHPASVTGILLS